VRGVDSDLTDSSALPSDSADIPATTIVEKGSFTIVYCDCGWYSPARRSRDKARKDAAQHSEQHSEQRHVEQHFPEQRHLER
jgi:hypothetical protein